MKTFAGLTAVLLFTLISLSMGPAAGADDLVENGDFEAGDFEGWSTDNLTQCEGNWLVYSGSVTPATSNPILPPPSGDFAAVTDELLGQSCSLLLYQDIEVPEGAGEVLCSAVVYVRNSIPEYIIGNGLELSPNKNQQYRVDLMDPEAPLYDVGAGVIENLFQTVEGDPQSIGYTTLEFDLSGFAGQTVRLRAASVNNEGQLFSAIDEVTCLTENNATIPTLSEWGMISAALGMMLIGVFFAVRQRLRASEHSDAQG